MAVLGKRLMAVLGKRLIMNVSCFRCYASSGKYHKLGKFLVDGSYEN